MSSSLYLDRNSFHDVRVGERRVLFHLPTSALFELDGVGAAVLDFVKTRESLTEHDVRTWLSAAPGRAPTPAQAAEALHDLTALRVLIPQPAPRAAPATKIENFPLSTLVFNVNTGCNLQCTYCYKEDLETPARGRKMDFDTAARGIDLLLRQGAQRQRINVAFLGGEPLTHLPLIRQVVDYAERRCRALGKTADFTLTTNATLLTEDSVDWLDRHRFGISVSMDGPKDIHDRHRRTVGGHGSYDAVATKARMLLGRYRSRPVGARVTLAAGATDVVGIHRHLKNEIGFAEVGFAPVTAGAGAGIRLSPEELRAVLDGMKALGREALAAAREDREIGFSNLNQLLADLHEGRKKTLPCGAGVGLLALDGAGELHLCHRFAGSDLPGFGNVVDGIAAERLGAFLEAAAERSGKACASCSIRNLCAGGCYHESYAHAGDPLAPTYHYCDFMRDWVDFGLGLYVELLHQHPSFLSQHLGTRRVEP